MASTMLEHENLAHFKAALNLGMSYLILARIFTLTIIRKLAADRKQRKYLKFVRTGRSISKNIYQTKIYRILCKAKHYIQMLTAHVFLVYRKPHVVAKAALLYIFLFLLNENVYQ